MMDKNNKKINDILKKYKSNISDKDLSTIENLLSKNKEKTKPYFLFTDGACEFDDNYRPINAGIGGLVKFNDKTILSFYENIGMKTNNEAEYLALIKGISICIENNITKIFIFSDSELIVKQINGIYKVKNNRMIVLYKQVYKLLNLLESWELKHVLRDQNTEADELSKKGLLNKNNV